jgi:hypothetical protein
MPVTSLARVRSTGSADRDLRRSWVAVALVPVAFVLAMLVGEGLLSAQGYDPATPAIPVGAILLAGFRRC